MEELTRERQGGSKAVGPRATLDETASRAKWKQRERAGSACRKAPSGGRGDAGGGVAPKQP